MDELKKSLRAQVAVFLCTFLISAVLAWTQNQPAPQKPPETDAAQTDETHQISPKEADELFRSVDDILKFCSKETGLPIKHTVSRRLTSRDEVGEFLQRSMADDKDAERFRRSELVLK